MSGEKDNFFHVILKSKCFANTYKTVGHICMQYMYKFLSKRKQYFGNTLDVSYGNFLMGRICVK